MNKKHYIITGIAAYLILLVATIPAKPITDLINDNTSISIRGVSGTLWSGSAYNIVINNTIQLEKTTWSFTTWKLLTGKVAINTVTHFSGNEINSEAGSSFLGRVFINNFTAKISAEDVTKLANIPLAQLSGLISANIEHAEWKQGELPLAIGTISWKDAKVTVADTASLGDILITLTESEQQLLNADINNQGGDIKISGSAELIPEANYSAKVKLAPTATANSNIKQSLGLFAKKQKNGEYLLQYTGSLNEIGI